MDAITPATALSHIARTFFYTINTNVFLCAAAVYVTCYYLFGDETTQDAPPDGEPPSRTYFFAHRFKHLMALVYDDCIICREEPTTPVQVQPCGHICCEEHIREWFDRGNTRCPQCTQVLFIDQDSQLEMTWKLIIATTHLNAALTPIVLVLACDLSRSYTAIGSIVTTSSLGALVSYYQARKQWGGRWWRHMLDSEEDVASREDSIGFPLVVAFLWLLWTASYL